MQTVNSCTDQINVYESMCTEMEADYAYDYQRFRRHSGAFHLGNRPVVLSALVTEQYHRLEKGLTMPEPLAGFASGTLTYLMEAVPYLEAVGLEGLATRGARGALRRYVEFHDERGMVLPEGIDGKLRQFVKVAENSVQIGGTTPVTRTAINRAIDFDYERFIRSRHSIRQFTGDPVSPDVVQKAVSLAIKTPRVINKESRRVHAAYDADVREHLLRFQQGNRGFGHQAGVILVVTSDLRCFTGLNERNQCWIDGGLFAMSLVYAFHASGLGTCMLNWSTTSVVDRAMRDAFAIPDNEAVITFIAVGHLPEQLDVAASPAPSSDEILSTLNMPL